MTVRYKPAQVTDEHHEWLRVEAFTRRTTITAEIAEAIELLRKQRARKAANAPESQTTGVQVPA